MKKKVVIFGEMLWDCLPSGPVPGGAPMNVALNLHQLGLDSHLISAVGNDLDGEKLLSFLKEFELPLSLIQVNEEHETSKVLVDDSDPENMKYDIVSPVAWDYIQWKEGMELEVQDTDAFVFGTLGVRNPESLMTLLKLLHKDSIRLFDANLRPPYYDFEIIETLLGFTDILKLNEDEVEIFADYFNVKPDMISICKYLDQHFPMDLICITKGAKGAMIYKKGQIIEHPGYSVKVQDTIGAGDAFLSGFIKMYLEGKDLEDSLDFACKLGAFLATQKGGTPKYNIQDIEKI
ncbi:carbohydrate kinase family protein [Algoriphagus machipongonensis]|uniref:Fructokinase n=1 Tax=Algoriphagus machipongonensis TaxID=388413 RepID=A3HTS8_9BACT|nr:carbohydrate kinase [Algoriphagus machipongonensis]EAZ83246.1 fructokinase [Algoriphagus machipongonensis]